MTLEGESTAFRHGIAKTLYLSIPSLLASDSACPIKEGDKVRVEIRGRHIVFYRIVAKESG